ncbi:MAG: XDD4 family exosortase-dependent surface protein [Fimbriimonadaceae bacterium]
MVRIGKFARLIALSGAAVCATSGHSWSALFVGGATAPSGNTLAATALFQTRQVGSSWFLDVLLANASTDTSGLTHADVLTGLFFSFGSPVSLTPLSASLPSGTVVWDGGSVVSGHTSNVGGEWAYATGLTVGSDSGLHGIGSAGYGLFGPADRFDTGQNLSGPTDPNGLQYGILPAISSWPSGWNPTLDDDPLISNAVLFTFGTGGSELAVMPNAVWAQYGTNLNDPRFRMTSDDIPPEGVVPEPATLSLAAAAVATAFWRKRRR